MENTRFAQELRKVGLSEKAALVYGAVLELGIAFPTKVAERTKLNRSTVYAVLTDLAVKGLVTEIERNRKICYQIENPGRLVNFAHRQAQLAADRVEHTKKLVPELEGLFAIIPQKPRVRFFEGLDGVLAVYEEHISEKSPYEMVAYSNVEKLMERIPERFVQRYVRKKASLGITSRAIFPDAMFSRAYDATIYRGAPKKTLVQARYIPADIFPYQGEITMYGKQKVSIINFHEDALIGVIVEDATIAGMMRMVFELAWKGAAPSGSRSR